MIARKIIGQCGRYKVLVYLYDYRYHRVLRKEKMKNEKKSLEELEKTDPEAYAEKLMAVDKQRVEVR